MGGSDQCIADSLKPTIRGEFCITGLAPRAARTGIIKAHFHLRRANTVLKDIVAMFPPMIAPVATAKDIRSAYIRLRYAPREFGHIDEENKAIIYLLDQVIWAAEHCDFLDEKQLDAINHTLDSCERTVNELTNQLSKYRSSKKSWKGAYGVVTRIRWAAGTTRDVKQQLIMHYIMLGTVLDMIDRYIPG